MMDLNALVAFVAVASEGSFSRAAANLYLTQPAISKRIAALEQDLGAPVFDRIGRGIALTEAGRALLPRARDILQGVDACRRVVADLSGTVSGPLKIGTSHHIGLRRLPPFLRRFARVYPEVDLDIRFMDSEQVCAAVADGMLELGVVTLPLAPAPQLRAEPLWDDPLMVMFAPDHPLAGINPLSPEALAAHPAILPEADTYTRTLIEQAFARQGLKLQVRLQTNYMETIRMMVAVGLGWSLLPRTLAGADLIDVELAPIAVRRQLGLVIHQDRTPSHAVSAFRALLQDPLLPQTDAR
ncbi:MAG: LysR family transcriptional regulator [Candidatus Macondimonas sp.]|jgi:DNA-binding transcriptional LysR family regulator